MMPVIKWKRLPVRQEFKDYGWQKRWGLKIDPDKYYFEFKIGIINAKQKIIIEVTDIRQAAQPSSFSLTLVDGKVDNWSQDKNTYSGDNQVRQVSSLWLDFKEKIVLDGFPDEYREFVANL